MQKKLFLVSVLFFFLTGCFSVSVRRNYEGPKERPPELLAYYSKGHSYTGFSETIFAEHKDFIVKKIKISTDSGDALITLFEKKRLAGEKRDSNLVLVFPLLGGNNKIVDYFSEYFVKEGFDSAVVERSDDFKNPAHFYNMEKVLHDNVVRDRIALDFFEEHYGKKNFGSFGISRGAINVVMTAGVDARLKHNVIALGGTDLVRIMKATNERRIENYKLDVMQKYNLSEKQFFTQLTETLRTDPKFLAQYLDARTTLMFLGLFDKTVPIQYGMKLREGIGGPRTVYLVADHYLSAGFTGVGKAVSPTMRKIGFPFDYIEQEAVQFYDKSFETSSKRSNGLVPFKILQAPINAIAGAFNFIGSLVTGDGK